MDQAFRGDLRSSGEPAPRPRRSPDELEPLAAPAHRIAIDTSRSQARDHCLAGRWDLAFPLLSASLATFDQHAGELGPDADHDLRAWAGRLLPVLAEFPQASLAHIERAFSDFAIRWGSDPGGLRMLCEARLRLGPVTGDWASEEQYHDRWLELGGPRPGRADDVELMIGRLVLRGDPVSVARGVELAEPALSGRAALDHSLLGTTCLLALPLARAGALHLARALGDTAHRKLTQQDVRAEVAGSLIEFCALTGDLPTAVDLAERRLWVFDGLHRPYGLMEFATATAVLAREVIAAGYPGHILAGGQLTMTAEDLYERARDTAIGLAAQFDARNGNDHHGTRVRTRLVAQPLHVARRRELRPAGGVIAVPSRRPPGPAGAASIAGSPVSPGPHGLPGSPASPGSAAGPDLALTGPMRRPADPAQSSPADPGQSRRAERERRRPGLLSGWRRRSREDRG